MVKLRTALLLVAAMPTLLQAEPLSEEVVVRAAARLDQLLAADLGRAKATPEARIDDGTFVRRAYLGIVGRIPSAAEADAFIEDQAVGKRAVLVEKLVASGGFDSHLYNWMADLLRVQSRGDRQEKSGLGWHVWLRRSLARNKPWDQLVREMLVAQGHTVNNPAVGYYLRDRNMRLDNFSNTMQVFLGQQMGCAQCHDHPFKDRTQYEYYQMAAFGGGIEYRSEDLQQMARRVAQDLRKQPGVLPSLMPAAPTTTPADAKEGKNDKLEARKEARGEKPKAKGKAADKPGHDAGRQLAPIFRLLARDAIAENPGGLLRLPQDYKYGDGKPGDVVKPLTLFGAKVEDVPAEERLEVFASWVTSRDNPYFTKTIVNRMWHRVFGAPIYDSLDDLSESSRTLHPQVVALLEQSMKACNYDLRQFSRILYRTQLFERACMAREPVLGEPVLFKGMVLRRMSAEQLHDSFLVIRNGSVNDSPSAELEERWNGYVQMVTSLFKAESRELLVLAESARQAEEQINAARIALREARNQLAKASGREARMEAQVVLKQAQEKIDQVQSSVDPFMAMQMMGGAREKNGPSLRRASEQPSPFNTGSLVREFGGSDRETPMSSRAQATVPQVLALLNNWQTHPLGGKQSDLSRQLLEETSPAERLERLFLALYATRPTAQETQRYVGLVKDRATLVDLATAMLNSNRFLFIQ